MNAIRQESPETAFRLQTELDTPVQAPVLEEMAQQIEKETAQIGDPTQDEVAIGGNRI